MNKISIGFSRPKKWKPLAWLIQKAEGSEYSHVFVTWHCTNIDRRKVFEAVGSGIRILSNTNFKKNAHIVELYQFEVEDATLFKIEQEAHDMTGKPYGYKALLGLAIMRVFNFFNRVFGLKGKQHNPFKDGNYSQVCVEAGGMVLDKIVDLPLEFEDFGLKEFNDVVKSHGKRVSQRKVNKINRRK
jgi:hypothetical protein